MDDSQDWALVAQQQTPYLSTPILNTYLGNYLSTCECGNPYEDQWDSCYACKMAKKAMGPFYPDFFVPISLRWQRADDPFRKLTSYYKEHYGTKRQINQVVSLILHFMTLHWRSCLAPRLEPFTWIAVVPSSKPSRPKHLMHQLTGAKVLTGLRWTGQVDGSMREVSEYAFECTRRIKGGVLLIDDTWTTGSKARSAAWALRKAGAEKVGILTLARHISSGAKGFDLLEKASKAKPFDWNKCALCAS